MYRLAFSLATWFGCLSPMAAQAQPAVAPEPSAYVGGAFLASIQPTGTFPLDGAYLTTPLGGTTLGVSGFIGRRVNRFVSLEAEVSRGGTLSGQQTQECCGKGVATTSFTMTQRDLIFTGLARFSPFRGTRHTQIEPLVGISLAHETTAVDHAVEAYRIPTDYSVPAPGLNATLANNSFGFAFGLDVALPITGRVAIVPSVRMYSLWLNRDESLVVVPYGLGLRSDIYRVGLGARILL